MQRNIAPLPTSLSIVHAVPLFYYTKENTARNPLRSGKPNFTPVKLTGVSYFSTDNQRKKTQVFRKRTSFAFLISTFKFLIVGGNGACHSHLTNVKPRVTPTVTQNPQTPWSARETSPNICRGSLDSIAQKGVVPRVCAVVNTYRSSSEVHKEKHY